MQFTIGIFFVNFPVDLIKIGVFARHRRTFSSYISIYILRIKPRILFKEKEDPVKDPVKMRKYDRNRTGTGSQKTHRIHRNRNRNRISGRSLRVSRQECIKIIIIIQNSSVNMAPKNIS